MGTVRMTEHDHVRPGTLNPFPNHHVRRWQVDDMMHKNFKTSQFHRLGFSHRNIVVRVPEHGGNRGDTFQIQQ